MSSKRIEPPTKLPRVTEKPTAKHHLHICVSGAAKGETVEMDYELAYQLGRQVALQGHTLVTGATIGLPDWAAQGAKSVGGMSIGISPASSYLEHVEKYRLPTTSYDFIMYTGLHYVGRDALLIQSSDAVLSVGGRMGTVHEFATAIESHKPVGVLQDAGGTGEEFEHLMKAAGMCHDGICDGEHEVIFNNDPEKLVKELIKLVDKKHGHNHKQQ